MTVETMLTEGLFLMLTGMGFVIVFLSILVLLLTLMAKFLPVQNDITKPSLAKSAQHKNNRTITAVLTAAVHQHRNQNEIKD